MDLQQLLSNLDEIIWVYDLESNEITFLSPSIRQVTGHTPSELCSNLELLQDIISIDDLPMLRKAWANCLLYGRGEVDLRLNVDTQTRWYQLKGKKAEIDGHSVILGSAHDIRLQKGAESALAQLSERYDTILQSALTGYLLFNLGGYIINCNEALAEILGLQIHKITSQHVSDFIHPSQPFEEKFIENIKIDGRWRGETALLGSTGDVIQVEFAATIVKLHDRDLIVAFIDDISQKHKVRQQLMKVMRHSEEVSRMKTNIMANVTHEIKSPVHRIQGLIKVMSKEFGQIPEIREYLENIEESSNRVLNSLTAILEFSRLDSQLAKDQFSSVKVCESIIELVDQFQAEGRAKNVKVNFHPCANITPVNGDKFLLQESWKILIGNAIRFTDEGSVDIHVSEMDDKVVVKIKDSGRGMSDEFLAKIFEPFSQESDGFNRSHEGLGLGLSIAKRYIEGHDGNISLISKRMKGTEVLVELPGIN